MECVYGLEVHIGAHTAGAADARNKDGIHLVQVKLVHDTGQLLHDQADSAAGAPDRREEISLELVLDGHCDEPLERLSQPTRAGEPDLEPGPPAAEPGLPAAGPGEPALEPGPPAAASSLGSRPMRSRPS